MTPENDSCITTTTIHNAYYSKQISRQLKLLSIRPALSILMQKAVLLYVCYTDRKFLAGQ
jgi:hypothetical protein